MASVPVAKLASLLVRTLAKPIATKLKEEAGLHPRLSSSSQWIGQRIHSVSSRINVYNAGFNYVGVKPLPKEEALSKDFKMECAYIVAGVYFISELFIFSVAVSVVVVENLRSEYLSAIKKDKEAEEAKSKRDTLEKRFSNIEHSIEEIEESLPPSSLMHLQQLRKLKRDLEIINTHNKNIADEVKEIEIAEKKKKVKLLPQTPRASRILKAKKSNEDADVCENILQEGDGTLEEDS